MRDEAERAPHSSYLIPRTSYLIPSSLTYNNYVPKRVALFLTLVLLLSPTLEARRRAMRSPGLPDPSTPAGWLAANARVLHGTELTPVTSDLEPLRAIVGNAPVVGLGDGTHGTHEYPALKLRMIDFLVREMDFDVLAMEAPFPVMNRLNAYIQGGSGDPRAILNDAATRLAYWFWATEEMLAVIEWMRAYNAQRGDRPAIEIAGVDVYDDVTAAADVVAYLRIVDPAAAAAAEADYACVPSGGTQACGTAVDRVRNGLVAKEAQYIAATSPRAYHDALRNARVVLATNRDFVMAEGALWAREHRGTSGKVLYWAHNEHVSESVDGIFTPAGVLLRNQLGEDYVAIGMMTGAGAFRGWRFNRGTQMWDRLLTHFEPVEEGSYPWYFGQHGASMLLIPLQGDVPSWLSTPSTYVYGGSEGSLNERVLSAPETYDAVVYFDHTTPVEELR